MLTANLDRCMRSWNTFNDLCNKVWLPNKTDLNLGVFYMITGKKKKKILTKQ